MDEPTLLQHLRDLSQWLGERRLCLDADYMTHGKICIYESDLCKHEWPISGAEFCGGPEGDGCIEFDYLEGSTKQVNDKDTTK